jgi:MscS family membrane protein
MLGNTSVRKMMYRTDRDSWAAVAQAAASAAESMKARSSGILFLVGILSAPPAYAQALAPKPAPGAEENKPAEKAIEDPQGRSTPYGTVHGFLQAAENHDYERAAEYLDSKQPSERKQELARQLKLIMDRGLAMNLDTLSREPEGKLEEGLRNTRELVGVAQIGSESLEILLDRIQRGANPPIWLFSAETLLSVPAITEKIQPGWMELHLPKVLLEKRLLSVQLYRWVAALIAIPSFLIITWLLTRALGFTLARAVRRLTSERGPLPDLGLRGPIRLLIFALLIRLGSMFALSLSARQFWTRVATVIGILALVWLYIRLTDALAAVMAKRLRRTNVPGRIAVLQLLQGLSKALALIAGMLIILHMGGVNLTAVLTGLGVGGIAIAFAAQKTIENLFGTIMVVSDRVVRVGDFCRIGDTLGTIEEVGLRSTRVRTLAHTVLTVPNGQLAGMSLENFATRQRILLNQIIGLRYDTTAEQLSDVLGGIRRLLDQHPNVEPESARVRFVRFGGASVDLELFAYVITSEYPVFLEIQEDLLLQIMRIIEASGSGLAFPFQVTYAARDKALGAKKS